MPGHAILSTVTIEANNPAVAIVIPAIQGRYDEDGRETLVTLAIKNPEPLGGELVTANNAGDDVTPSAIEFPGGSAAIKVGPFIYPRTMPKLFAANPTNCLVTAILSLDSPELLKSGQ